MDITAIPDLVTSGGHGAPIMTSASVLVAVSIRVTGSTQLLKKCMMLLLIISVGKRTPVKCLNFGLELP